MTSIHISTPKVKAPKIQKPMTILDLKTVITPIMLPLTINP